MRLELHQVVAAAGAVQRCAPVQHQALATGAHRAMQQRLQRRVVCHPFLRHGLHPWLAQPFDDGVQGREALVECAAMRGQVKHHEAHPAPGGVIGLLLARGGLGVAEAPTPGPQFSVHWHLGPAGGEPGGGRHRLAATGAQRMAVPEAPHAIVFFADPVIGQRQAGAIDLRQQQGRRVCRQRGQCRKCGECQQGEAVSAVHGAIDGAAGSDLSAIATG